MSQVIDIFTVDSLQTNEFVYYARSSSVNNNHPTFPSASAPSEMTFIQTYNSSTTPYWRPSDELKKILRILYEEDYAQFPCIPCSYCSRLLYPQSAKWVTRNNDITYPLEISFPEINLITNPRNTAKIAVCDGCKSNSNNRTCLTLASIPQCIHDVPYAKRKYLSPIYLHTSLGRSAGTNPFAEYRSLTGQMGYSKNRRTFSLYSGMIGAFLQNADLSVPDNRWYHPSLRYACDWLQLNNPYLSAYHSIASHLLTHNSQTSPTVWPNAAHVSDNNNEFTFPVNSSDIVVPSYVFPDEIHNEDAHYSRLAIGFLQGDDERQIPLRFNDPELEAILFPDLFPDGRGFYGDVCNRLNSNTKTMTYGKYIKSQLMGFDSRFRLHPVWMMWSYMQLEKLRNFQNNARIYRQNTNLTHSSLSAIQWLRKSHYTNEMIVDEQKSMPLPTFIRTGDSYFKEKEHHLNTMVNAKGLPTLFVTLSMAESKWIHLTEILRNTDNGDTNPTNRPFHVCMYFIQRYRSLKKRLWHNRRLSGWKSIRDFFERVEFQNRGAAHLHIVLWTEATIEEMIATNEIRSTIPNPENEPELYAKVHTHQIHTCQPHLCGGPPPIGEQCKRHFPRPFADRTYHDPTSLHYIYKAITEEDRWVVPYHAPTLIAWDAHSNVQYVTSKGFARYMTKYISKAEPSHIFNIRENNRYYHHVLGRRLGAMEVIFLITGETICNSSATVNFLQTDPPNIRSKTILPVANLLQNPENPYYADTVEKYFRRPYGQEFNNLKYEEYYQQYEIRSPTNTSTNRTTRDLDGRIIVKRKKPILTRTRFMKLNDGETYYYYKLLKTKSWRSEQELKGSFNYYRDHYFSIFPNELQTMREETRSYISRLTTHLEHQFTSIVDSHLQTLQQEISITNIDIIKYQLNMLKRLPHITPFIAGTDLPRDQYNAITVLSNMMGSRNNQWPYYFLTGSAGTGKSFIIQHFRAHLQQTKKRYIMLAPTGVAAQNVDGMTIHSALKISSTTTNSRSSYQTLIFNDASLLNEMRCIKTIIIDEVSMVSSSLFTFISDTFARIHNNHQPFGGINVLVAGDLCQLPPVQGTAVFHSPVWQLFYPLFLCNSQRQINDNQYFNLLEEVRVGRISDASWQMLQRKHSQYSNTLTSTNAFNTTSIVGYKQSAEQLNILLCNLLQVTCEDDILISTAVDKVNGEVWTSEHSQRMFKQHTNLPVKVRLQPGARVMYLNNDMINQGVCNGTIGIVTKIIQPIEQIHVSFLGNKSLIHAVVSPKTYYFSVNGTNASRRQFPLQNCFALTVHKSQGLTLPHISLYLDRQFFAVGQAYTALSRAPSWNCVEIACLDRQAFSVDQDVIREYERLKSKATTNPLITCDR